MFVKKYKKDTNKTLIVYTLYALVATISHFKHKDVHKFNGNQLNLALPPFDCD